MYDVMSVDDDDCCWILRDVKCQDQVGLTLLIFEIMPLFVRPKLSTQTSGGYLHVAWLRGYSCKNKGAK